jgi:uncharacterized protein (TIGR00375 family)
MATSKECNPVNLHRWASLKGVSLVGTGDFTHPGWRVELREHLLPAEPGFYRLKDSPSPEIPGQPEVRFVVTGEISAIYKKNDRTRKVHHLVVLPSLEAADRISARLEALGMNIRSDGRPILGLDSYLLFQLILEAEPEVIFIPAHIWTPHFSVFGSNSGFDTIEECYEDLTPHIPALETGLSSDPAMNWRWSALDRFNLVSNSDAHNPQNLAREANLFNTEFSYPGLKAALQDLKSDRFGGTLEFFPEEGKYHLDGHRNCQVCWEPSETREHGMICPVCNRKVTVGVLHRVAELADRPAGFRPEHAKPFLSLVQLREIIGAAMNVGSATCKAEQIYHNLLHQFGPELDILMKVDLGQIASKAGSLVATGIQRLRERKVLIQPGYDGEYGVVSLFDAAERLEIMGQNTLFGVERVKKPTRKKPLSDVRIETGDVSPNTENSQPKLELAIELSPEQKQVVSSVAASISVIAGPGAGKTRTLVERIVYLIRDKKVDPAEITAVTFTNKAAAEIKARLAKIFTGDAGVNRLNLGTFHSLAWRLLNLDPAGLTEQLIDPAEVEALLQEVLREKGSPVPTREALRRIGLIKNKYLWEERQEITAEMEEIYQAFQKKLAVFRRCDFDDIMLRAVALWEESPEWLNSYRSRFTYLLVDEFQDINALQYRLIKLWAKDCRGLMVIGDPNQSIYGFRASSSKFFQELANDLPQTVTFRFATNYRAPGLLVEAANALIEPELRQQPVNPVTKTPALTWLKSTVERNAAKAITREIVGLMGGSTMLSADGRGLKTPWIGPGDASYSLSDFAIVFRTNRQAEALETALADDGLPYRVIGPAATFESETVKEFLCFFRYLLQPEDPYLFRAAITQTCWGLDEAENIVVSRWLSEHFHPGNLCLDCVLRLAVGPLANKLHRFQTVYNQFHRKSGSNPRLLVAEWMNRGTLQDFIELEKLSRISANYRTIEEFLRFLPLATEADLSRCNRQLEQRELISLSTIHAAKGLEYPVVFLAGAEEGLLPYGANPQPDELLEEQRLFYVALTRAKERFYFTSSSYHFKNNETLAIEPSRFIRLLPERLLTVVEFKEKLPRDKQLELF